MLQLKKKEFTKIIKKLRENFTIKERHTGDLQVRIYYKDKLVVGTKCSEGKGDIHPIIVQRIRKQLGLANDQELAELKNYPLSCDRYVELLKQRGVI